MSPGRDCASHSPLSQLRKRCPAPAPQFKKHSTYRGHAGSTAACANNKPSAPGAHASCSRRLRGSSAPRYGGGEGQSEAAPVAAGGGGEGRGSGGGGGGEGGEGARAFAAGTEAASYKGAGGSRGSGAAGGEGHEGERLSVGPREGGGDAGWRIKRKVAIPVSTATRIKLRTCWCPFLGRDLRRGLNIRLSFHFEVTVDREWFEAGLCRERVAARRHLCEF